MKEVGSRDNYNYCGHFLFLIRIRRSGLICFGTKRKSLSTLSVYGLLDSPADQGNRDQGVWNLLRFAIYEDQSKKDRLWEVCFCRQGNKVPRLVLIGTSSTPDRSPEGHRTMIKSLAILVLSVDLFEVIWLNDRKILIEVHQYLLPVSFSASDSQMRCVAPQLKSQPGSGRTYERTG